MLLWLQVTALCRALRIFRPAAWVTLPTTAPAIERGTWSRVVFNRSDDFGAFHEANGVVIRGLERRLFEASDAVVYVNRHLYRREEGCVRSAHWLGHGVDFEHFSGKRTGSACVEVPSALDRLARPIIGFYGALDEYTIDLELLVKVARHVRPATVLIIGPKQMDIARLEAEPNVVYLGPIEYAELPKYAAAFDVALMPWLQNDWIRGCNPIKLKEYLAMGFPVVTTRFLELEPYEGLVYVADTHEQFISAVDAALHERDPELVLRRRAAVSRDSWDVLAQRVASLIGLP